MRRSLQVLALVLALPGALACNRRVFQEAKNSCDKTLANDIEVPTQKKADILIVVDNSGSMAEEQQKLVNNFLNKTPGECPLTRLDAIPDEFKNPIRAQYTGDGPLAKCGFIQLLAAFENDFRVGVITTDVAMCDNRFGNEPDGWGFRPQRGCLQPDADGRKVIAAADLRENDNPDDPKKQFADRFEQTLDNIQTFGSSFERGLDAVNWFFNPDLKPNELCVGDRDTFRRPDAALVVIFLTDEEDCSHGLGPSVADVGVFDDEQKDEICGKYNNTMLSKNAANCYEKKDLLSPVEKYVEALQQIDPQAKVAVIAGGLGEAGNVAPGGCRVGQQGTPEGGCFEARGLSNYTSEGELCGPDVVADRGQPCCLADPGARYYQFADLVGKKTTDSICNDSFSSTMLDIAAFIAAVDFLELSEPPANPDLILVEVTRAESGETQTIPRLVPGANCANTTGWALENDVRVVLCGGARPGPGDKVQVRAAAVKAEGCLQE